MAKFVYNNAKNASINYTIFELNCSNYLRVLLKKNVNSHLKSHSTDKLAKKLNKLIEVYCQNLFYI